MTDTGGQSQSSVTFVEPARSLLHIFSPRQKPGPAAGPRCKANRPLWALDATHRANNLAQLAYSLSRIDPVRLCLCTDGLIVAEAEALAASYAELGVDADHVELLPCATLLKQIATALVALFGAGATISLQPCADEMVLAPERRRALILIASELIINALKYAFSDGRRGSIYISLVADQDKGELVVEDDGIGVTGIEPAGSGSGLVGAMTGLLGGHFGRDRRPSGGTRCSISFPLTIGEEDVALPTHRRASAATLTPSTVEGNNDA